MGRGDFSEDVPSNWMDEKEFKQAVERSVPQPCDWCDKPGVWHLRAHQYFLCEEHRKKLEWHKED